MNPARLIAIVLVVLGALGLAYGGFTYTQDTHTADIGSMHLSVDEKKRINVPVWAGVGMLVVGVLLLGVPGKSRS